MEKIKKLHRSNNKMIAGVCSGIAEYLGVDPTVIRILYILMLLLAGFGLLLYLLLWLIIPMKVEE